MKLKSNHVYWPQIYDGPEPRVSPLAGDVKCEVAIIGGGISGALMGYHLMREGMQVVLVDRRAIGHGSSAASTGLLQYEIDTPLVELIEKIGRDRATAAYRASVDSLGAFEPLVDELGNRCGLTARPSVYLASRKSDVKDLLAECEARQSIGIDVKFLSSAALRDAFNLTRPAALVSSRAFDVDPFRLTLRLIERSIEKGMQAFAHTEIVEHVPRENGVTLRAASGARIDAGKVIFATGYETKAQLPPNLCRLCSTYALVSEPVQSFEDWPGRCLIWEAARPYLYMRTTEDSRIMVGGEDVDIVEPGARDRLLPAKAQTLGKRFSELFPTIPIRTATAWAGTFSQTKDGLPFIGTLPQFPHSYFALGYGGNGITFSLMAAQIIRDLLMGSRNEQAGLFAFDR